MKDQEKGKTIIIERRTKQDNDPRGKVRDVPLELIRSLSPARFPGHARFHYIPIQAGYPAKVDLRAHSHLRGTTLASCNASKTRRLRTYTRDYEPQAGRSVYEGRVDDDGAVNFFGVRAVFLRSLLTSVYTHSICHVCPSNAPAVANVLVLTQ
ncbi:hypothetical protein EXIGLDRAFT_778342 [Exidia glandulosa HHB12029]|uniref:Uncharacterized protein n=1 Tax=Exidia glandulosa HHB12029 TaxID=1314781 RepID=A0A165CKG8_EXIGL|nr:hypothetical protein EXIGLDRAFT_778342 [Exidia glandulosa HHB12029]